MFPTFGQIFYGMNERGQMTLSIMPYYGLFLHNILYTHLHWILPLCVLRLCSMTHYDITMGNDIARDAHSIMPYHGFFLRNILYTDLHWILPL